MFEIVRSAACGAGKLDELVSGVRRCEGQVLSPMGEYLTNCAKLRILLARGFHAPHGIGLAEPNQWSSNCCRPFGIAPDWAADLRLTGCVIRPSDCDHRSNVGPPVLQH